MILTYIMQEHRSILVADRSCQLRLKKAGKE